MQIFDPPPVAVPPPPEVPRASRRPTLPALRPSLPSFLRRPLAWVIAAETAVTAAFLLAAVHLLSAALPAAQAAVALSAPSAEPTPTSEVAPDIARLLPAAGEASPSAQPGLGRSPGFLGGLLSGLNQDQASFERAQWSALQALSGAIRSYIEGVVVPAVEKAARGSASPRSP